MHAPSAARGNSTGSVLAVVLIAIVALAGMIGALSSVTVTHTKASATSNDRELAYQAAASGVSYYMARYGMDDKYFDLEPLPHAPLAIGDGEFELVAAAPENTGTYGIVIEGRRNGATYRLGAAIGKEPVKLPPGISVVGTGNKSTTVFTTAKNAILGSYDPDDGAFNAVSPGDEIEIAVNGSAKLTTTKVYGDVSAQGTISTTGSSITGTVTPNTAPNEFADIDPLVNQLMSDSKAKNDNAKLAAVFGTKWKPVAGAQNYGDLIVSGGTYTVPPGTFRFRKLELLAGAKVTFDTTGGPTTLCYVGSGAGTGTGNDLIVSGSSKLIVGNGATTNGLMTVLGTDCDFNVAAGSTFGQSATDVNNAGYTQIISLGGNASSDAFTVAGTVYGRLYAAAHAVSVTGKMFGSALARTVSVGTGATFAYDEGHLGTTLPVNAGEVSVMATWPGGYETAPPLAP